MNNTNRALNRALILVVGLAALLAGTALLAITTVPVARDQYRTTATSIHGNLTGWFKNVPLFDTDTSWAWILILATLTFLGALLLVFIVRQGHGHQNILLREDTTPSGTTIIDAHVAHQAIKHDLDNRPEILASHISTYQVRRTTVLKVAVNCRRGESPRQLAEHIEHTLTALDTLLGRQIPALIQIRGGFRTHLSRPTRVPNTPRAR